MENEKPKKVVKRIFSSIIVILIIGLVFVGMYAYSLINNPDIITIGVEESYTLKPREADFSVRSYNADIVTPTFGSTVTGETLGDAVVCVKYTYFDRDFYRFRVVDAPKSVVLNMEDVHMGLGETKTLKATCAQNNHDFAVSFKSDNENVATVNKHGEITTKNVGKCNITASSYNGITDKCKVTVSEAVTKFSLSESSITLGEKEKAALTPQFEKGEHSSAVKYLSSNEEIAQVSDGVITAKSVGKCTITASTYNDVTATCDVVVKKLPDKIDLLILDKYDIDTDINIITDMEKDCYAKDIEVSISDEDILEIDENNPMVIHPKKKGTATITLKLKNKVTAQKQITVDEYKKNSFDFKILNQFPTLPTGCEVVSLTSVLNHYGMDVSMTTMAEKYMPKKEYDYYSVSPHDYFLGTPYSFKTGMGCFSGCIVKTAENYFKDKKIDDYIALDISGCSTDELYNYLQNDIPVITWVTSSFVTPTVDGSWVVDGKTINWCNHEHCLVTTGYDKVAQTVTVADDSGGYSYTVEMAQYEKVFKGMGSMAVVVLKK
ncbi:MAG: hypothetical protein E7513_03435 [Ruminococcaceae bacterium]|nr:hypothetical protein [Oscillospiraceae bacterium]